MSEIFTSTAALALKETIERIPTDESGASGSKAVFPKYYDVRTMSDNYVEDYEIAGTGLAGEKPEGESMPIGGIVEGPLTRYNSRTYAQRMMVTEEAMEDMKYDKVIMAAKRNERSLWKLADFDGVLVLARAFNSTFVGGDGVELCSTAHPLAGGGTYSNELETPMSPSQASLSIMRAALDQQVGHDGVIEGYDLEAILCPVQQRGVWRQVLESEGDPTPGAFNAINQNNDLNLKLVPIKYWNTTTTNWIAKTSAEYGLTWYWRKKPTSRTWVNEDKGVMNYGIRARWTRGWTNPRGVFGSAA